jgi:hypothetical protein
MLLFNIAVCKGKGLQIYFDSSESGESLLIFSAEQLLPSIVLVSIHVKETSSAKQF